MTAKTISIGPVHIPASEYGVQASGILGIKESGKTYLSTLLGEQLHDAGVPFIAFDPINTWHNMRRPRAGRGGKGYPIVVAGGEEGNFPLTSATAPAIVEAAMREGVSLVLDLMTLSKSEWRTIVKDCVRLLLQKNKQYGLRHVFLEEAAEFVPQVVQDGQVYAEVEKLVRMGGNARLGCTLINPRAQEVNKAVLELCEHLFLFRQRGKNAIQNLSKWFEVSNVTKELEREIIASLPDLPQGQCWAWMGGDNPKPPRLVQVQQKKSFHPNRREMRGDAETAIPKAVDVSSFIAALQTALPAIEAETAASDPKKLRARIAELERAANAAPTATASPAQLERAEAAGFKRGEATGFARGRELGTAEGRLAGAAETFDNMMTFAREAKAELKAMPKSVAPRHEPELVRAARADAAPGTASKPSVKAQPAAAAMNADGLSKGHIKILEALSFYAAIGFNAPTRAQLAAVSSYPVTSGGFKNLLGSLRSADHIHYPTPGTVQLTLSGHALAPAADVGRSIRDRFGSVMSNSQAKVLDCLPRDGSAMTRDELADASGYPATSGGYKNLLGSLRTLGVITYPEPGLVAVEPWVWR